MNNKTHVTSETPPGWGSDHLSAFIQNATENTHASFHNLKLQYEKLRNIDASFCTICNNMDRTPDWFASFFLFRAHAAFLGAVRLALSGQIPETYMVLRGCLESSLYGFYISRKSAARETWLRRHDSEETKRKVKAEFTIKNLLASLAIEDADIHKITKQLYEATIDYGGHPNELSILSVIEQQSDEHKITFQTAYLVGNEITLHLSLKTCAQIGLCSLFIFKRIYQKRFDILGLTHHLETLKNGI